MLECCGERHVGAPEGDLVRGYNGDVFDRGNVLGNHLMNSTQRNLSRFFLSKNNNAIYAFFAVFRNQIILLCAVYTGDLIKRHRLTTFVVVILYF